MTTIPITGGAFSTIRSATLNRHTFSRGVDQNRGLMTLPVARPGCIDERSQGTDLDARQIGRQCEQSEREPPSVMANWLPDGP
ncbi:hypothetical protein LQG66_36855 [Bradyrhizobium ontarionense]|uniref:Uncharacterized protein n=1 Tax=Bradyrhizobium ontarionense TaxID=2898149 RepID=A0ABY3RD65_9BRAD|nr:hypothetical protein [Bradyrhizobium sp. A19]UFZ04687.1 hypothetical protein LQG66_36855 [Bradyrhizobium sp. A19]